MKKGAWLLVRRLLANRPGGCYPAVDWVYTNFEAAATKQPQSIHKPATTQLATSFKSAFNRQQGRHSAAAKQLQTRTNPSKSFKKACFKTRFEELQIWFRSFMAFIQLANVCR